MRITSSMVMAFGFWLLIFACSKSTEPEEWKCKDERPAYYVPNVRGTYTLVYRCHDKDVAGTPREWRDGPDYENPPSAVSRPITYRG